MVDVRAITRLSDEQSLQQPSELLLSGQRFCELSGRPFEIQVLNWVSLQSFLQMKVFRKSLFAWIALVGIVFSQLALSAYACPFLATPGGEQTAEMSADMVGMPCAEMGMKKEAGPSALCVQHCDQGHQSVSSTQVPDFQSGLVLFLVLPSLASLEQTYSADLRTQPLVRTASTPPFLRTGRLRI
jgi:hypothetical protein